MATDKPRTQAVATKVALWRLPAFRAAVFQALLVVAIGAFGYYLLNNTLQNMEQRGITTGFGFLSNEAGFGILQSLIPYDETYTYGRTFFVGLLNTLLVAGLGIFFATFIGFFVGRCAPVEELAGRAPGDGLHRDIPQYPVAAADHVLVLRGTAAVAAAAPEHQCGRCGVPEQPGPVLARPVTEDGFGLVWLALLTAIVGVAFMARWAHRRQEATGQPFPTARLGPPDPWPAAAGLFD